MAMASAASIGRAAARGMISVNAVDVREFAEDARKTVDDRPYGGGPGMLMVPDVLTRAVESVRKAGSTVILTSPRGEVMNQKLAQELAEKEHLILVAGHYEGVDQRFIDSVVDREISIGDFVLSKAKIVKEGTDVTIVAEGQSVSTALKAGEILLEKGISAEIIDTLQAFYNIPS